MKTYRLASAIAFLFLSLTLAYGQAGRNNNGLRHFENKEHRPAQGGRTDRAAG